jgi:hypothetical protein
LLAAPKVSAKEGDSYEIPDDDREVEWADSHPVVSGRSRDANRPLPELSSKLKEVDANQNLRCRRFVFSRI